MTTVLSAEAHQQSKPLTIGSGCGKVAMTIFSGLQPSPNGCLWRQFELGKNGDP